VAWVWVFADDDPYTIRFEDGAWALAREQAETANATITASVEAWAQFLTTPPNARRLPREGMSLESTAAQAMKVARAFRAQLDGAPYEPDPR
jgi:hypothetical protein